MDFLEENDINVVKPKNKKPIIFENTDCYLFDYIENVPTIFDNATASYLINLLKIISRFKTSINNDEK